MAVFVIRSGPRHAVRQVVSITDAHGNQQSALLIELSQDGCRLSQLHAIALEDDQPLTISVAGTQDLNARVRWRRDATAGLLLDRPLHRAELAALVDRCRSASPPEALRRRV